MERMRSTEENNRSLARAKEQAFVLVARDFTHSTIVTFPGFRLVAKSVNII